MRPSPLTPAQTDALVREATAARAHAYCPYSGFAVGAAVLDERGSVTRGANVENAAYPSGLCAERTAAFAAVSTGARRFVAVAIVVDAPEPAAPCGACRQTLVEFGTDVWIVTCTTAGAREERWLDALLPRAFMRASLDAAYAAHADDSDERALAAFVPGAAAPRPDAPSAPGGPRAADAPPDAFPEGRQVPQK